MYDYFEAMFSLHSIKEISSKGLGFGPMWFLLMLFIVTFFCYYAFKKNYIGQTLTVIFFLASFFIKTPAKADYSLGSLVYYSSFFMLGYIVSSKKILDYFKDYTNCGLILSFVLLLTIEFISFEWYLGLKTVIAGLIFISFFYFFSLKINLKLLSFLGSKSMEIYLLHSPVFIFLGQFSVNQLNINNIFINITILLLFAIIGPLSCSTMYKKIKTQYEKN